MSETNNVGVTKLLLSAFKDEDGDAFLAHCAEGFVMTVGDPVGQDCVPFFGVVVGSDQYKKWLSVCNENPFQLTNLITDKVYDGGNNIFAKGSLEYIYKPTGEKITAQMTTHIRFMNSKAIELRVWLEGTRFYRKNESAA